MLPRQDSPPPPVDYANSDQLLFPSEASLTQISLLDDQSLNILAESPAFHPSTSVASFDQSDFNQILLEQVKSPLPNDTLQPPLPRTNGLSSSLSDRESRLEYQFESMSLADGNVSGLFGTDEKQEPSSSKSFTQKNDEKEARSTTLTLKEQEKTIDTLKKENFGLKLKIYYLEKRLDDLSPDQVDNALKENVDLKVNIQTLTQELRKYKKIILELHSAMDILQNSNQPCTLPHGMSPEEEAEYNAALSSASQHRDENERLHKMIADVSAENARLRASVRSSRTSSPLMGGLKLSRSNSGSGSSGSRPMDDFVDEAKWMLHRRLANNKNMANEAEFFKREWLQAKQTIEKQNETIRLLREENSFKANNAASGDSQLVKSILSDRDALVTKTERYAKMNQELQQDISKMRERNTEMVAQLLAKNKELDNVHANMDELVKSLNEAKQQLRTKTSECQQLRAELATYRGSPNGENVMERLEKLKQENKDHVATIDKLKRDIEEQKSAHQKEIEKLDAEIEQRELEFVKLEKEVVKIMARAEKLESREREKDALIVELEQKLERTADGAYEEELERLEQELRIKDETIAKYERRMERSDAHEDDIATLEERFAEVEATIKQKDAQIQQLEDEMEETLTKAEEAKARYEEDLQELERQFQEIERGLRERDVRIASLEGHLEAQTDAIQREKQIYQEEIKELEDKLQELAELLREKDMLLEHMEEQMEHRVAGARDAAQAYEDDLADIKEDMASRMIEAEEEWQARLADLEERLRETEEKLKKERRLANEKISEAVAAKRTLQQKLESANMKNGLLNDLLDQYQRSSESRNGSRSTQANQVLTKLNQELQRELEDRDRALERESQRVQELDALCARAMEEKEQLEELLIRRNSMITRLFERLESTKERKTVMENVLLRQATDEIDVSYNRRSDSALSSR